MMYERKQNRERIERVAPAKGFFVLAALILALSGMTIGGCNPFKAKFDCNKPHETHITITDNGPDLDSKKREVCVTDVVEWKNESKFLSVSVVFNGKNPFTDTTLTFDVPQGKPTPKPGKNSGKYGYTTSVPATQVNFGILLGSGVIVEH